MYNIFLYTQFFYKKKTATYIYIHTHTYTLTHRCSDTISFSVQKTADLREIAVSLDNVIQHSRLHQEGIITLENPLNTLFVSWHEYRWLLVFHESPHFLVRLDHWVLDRDWRNIEKIRFHYHHINSLLLYRSNIIL